METKIRPEIISNWFCETLSKSGQFCEEFSELLPKKAVKVLLLAMNSKETQAQPDYIS